MNSKYDPRGCFSRKTGLAYTRELEAENEALKQSINLMNINGYAPEILHKFLTELETENKKLREALEFYAENEHVDRCLEPYTVVLVDSEYNWGSESGKLNVAEKALNETK